MRWRLWRRSQQALVAAPGQVGSGGLRDVETFDDVGDVTAPVAVEPGDVVTTAEGVYAVEALIVAPEPGDSVVAVLGSRPRWRLRRFELGQALPQVAREEVSSGFV